MIDPVFIKPLDEDLLKKHFAQTKMIITLEEHSINGGLGSIINSFVIREEMHNLTVKNFGLPDQLIEHGSHAAPLRKIWADSKSSF